MGFRLPGIRRASFQAASKAVEVTKGYLAVYVGEKMKHFVIPISYLSQASFQELLSQDEEEFGYHHNLMGGLTIPCGEDAFMDGDCLKRLDRPARIQPFIFITPRGVMPHYFKWMAGCVLDGPTRWRQSPSCFYIPHFSLEWAIKVTL